MKIILLATWPNGQTQHIYSTSSRLIAKSQHNAKLNRHVIEVTGPDAKFLSECIWHPKAMSPAVPMVVDENYDPIPLGSEFGPNLVQLNPSTNEPNQKAAIPPVEEIRQELPEPREVLVLPEQPAAQEPEAVAQTSIGLKVITETSPEELRDAINSLENDHVTVEEVDEDPEADMPLEEVICKRVSEFGRLKVNTLAANLGVTASAIKGAVKNSSLLKITGTKNNTSVSVK